VDAELKEKVKKGPNDPKWRLRNHLKKQFKSMSNHTPSNTKLTWPKLYTRHQIYTKMIYGLFFRQSTSSWMDSLTEHLSWT
jgi:hypothetical protein